MFNGNLWLLLLGGLALLVSFKTSIWIWKNFGPCHLYKIIHGSAPQYLKQLLPPLVSQWIRYTLRGGDNFPIPRTKKSYIRNSFLGLLLDEWNRLDLNIRESNSNKLFKTKRRQQPCKLHKLSNLYNKTSGQASVHHTRMGMGLNIILLMTIRVLCAICELKILITIFAFAQPLRHHAPHVCPGYSRYW